MKFLIILLLLISVCWISELQAKDSIKVKILSVEATNNFSVNIELEIRDSDGTLIFSGTRGFVSQAPTKEEALAEIKNSIKNIYLQIKAEQASKMKETAESLIGTEIELK